MKRSFRDELQRPVEIPYPPQRIVSLCPSLTETIFALGGRREIVGRTEYCIHPAAEVRAVPTVGGTKTVDVEAVCALRPDLVITTKEENRREQVEALAVHAPVFVFDVAGFEQALAAIRTLGTLVDRVAPAEELAAEIASRFARLEPGPARRAAYLVWPEPYLAVGRQTYIHAVLERVGLENVCGQLPGRYPAITLAELRGLGPELVLLSSEPFYFDDSHVAELATHLPQARILTVDGEMFGWYGVRMLAAAEYLNTWLSGLSQ